MDILVNLLEAGERCTTQGAAGSVHWGRGRRRAAVLAGVRRRLGDLLEAGACCV